MGSPVGHDGFARGTKLSLKFVLHKFSLETVITELFFVFCISHKFFSYFSLFPVLECLMKVSIAVPARPEWGTLKKKLPKTIFLTL